MINQDQQQQLQFQGQKQDNLHKQIEQLKTQQNQIIMNAQKQRQKRGQTKKSPVSRTLSNNKNNNYNYYLVSGNNQKVHKDTQWNQSQSQHSIAPTAPIAHRLIKSKSNPSKLHSHQLNSSSNMTKNSYSVLIPSYNGSQLARKISKDFPASSRSASTGGAANLINSIRQPISGLSQNDSKKQMEVNSKFGVRNMPISPRSREKSNKQHKQQSREKEQMFSSLQKISNNKRNSRQKLSSKQKPKIQINKLNFNLVICNSNSPNILSNINSNKNNNNNNNSSNTNTNSGHNLSSPYNILNSTRSMKLSQWAPNNSNSSKNMPMNDNTKPNFFKSTQPLSSSPFSFAPIKSLSKGQYGNLYLAYSKPTNFLCVLKSFNRSKVTLDFLIDQFKIQLYCRHPNIISAYGYFFSRNKQEIYLILEPGLYNLYHQIKVNGGLAEHRVLNYTRQILKGLAYLHLNGIIHRDLKPENVIVCGGGVVKITDFGWSAITHHQRKTFCGTIDYVSPEVCYGIKYDNKIDCWSVGVLVFQMLTGCPPFETIQLETRKERPLLNYKQKLNFPKNISKQCRSFISKMLALDPKQRMSVAEALRDDWIANNAQQYSSERKMDIERQNKHIERALQ